MRKFTKQMLAKHCHRLCHIRKRHYYFGRNHGGWCIAPRRDLSSQSYHYDPFRFCEFNPKARTVTQSVLNPLDIVLKVNVLLNFLEENMPWDEMEFYRKLWEKERKWKE